MIEATKRINNNVINIAMLNSKVLGQNILEAYIPFVSTLIAVNKYKEIQIETICMDFYKKYSFSIPAMPMKEILIRMQKKNMINRELTGKIVPILDKIDEFDFESEYKENLKKYENIFNKFISFSKEHFSFEVKKDKAEECFCNFIKENFLDTILNDEKLNEVVEVIDAGNFGREMYVFYKYVIYMYQNDYELFKVIQKFCMGYVVANALSIDNVSSKSITFKNKKIFFDTNFILRLLGLEGDFYEDAYSSIIEILKENKCQMYIFSHTFDEIKNILESAKMNLKNTSVLSSEVQKYFWKTKKTEGDITLLISTLEKKLEESDIYISEIGYNNTDDKNQIDEKQLYEEIIKVYSKRKGFEEHSKKEMIWNDIRSMSLIYRDTKLIRAYSIQTMMDLFITTNQGLAYACKNFDKILGKRDNSISPCMTDVFLGTILWIQNPIRYDQCNEKQILASCYSSVKLDNKALSKFSRELDNLKENKRISEEDYLLMKQYEIIEDMLSDKIMGDTESIDEKTTFELIQEIKDSMREEYEQKLSIERHQKLQSELDKEKVEKKYADLIKYVDKKEEKKAKLLTILKIFEYIFIVIICIGVDLTFNVIDNIDNDKWVIAIRIVVYIILAIPTIKEIIKYGKQYNKVLNRIIKKRHKELEIE